MVKPSPAEVARDLAQAMARLRARLRMEATRGDVAWTWSQLTTLWRISIEGPTTASELAHAEHVRPQSMAETVASLLRQGLLRAARDPADGRRMLLTATEEGAVLAQRIPALREAWLGGAMKQLTGSELETLSAAAEIMQRLADSARR